MNWDVVVVHKSFDVLLALLLLDTFFPDAEHIDSAALVIWSSKGNLVVPVSLTVIETHEATLLEHMVVSNNLNELGMRWHSLEIGLFPQSFEFLFILIFKVFLSFHGV